jgi:hypothetical protein
LLGLLFKQFEREGFAMSYTMEDFKRDYAMEYFGQLTPEEQREAIERLPPERRQKFLELLPPKERLAGMSAEEIRQYLDELTAGRPSKPRKQRRKKERG